jgi:biotin synthase
MIHSILNKDNFTKNDIINLLKANNTDTVELFKKAASIKIKTVWNKVYFRGLIEMSNICEKDCYYCGIRKSNKKVERYNISDDEILKAAKFAYDNNYGSLVLQAGEIKNNNFTLRIENLLKRIKSLSNNKLGITLSLGEQTAETYKRWFDAGAHRYLLRIETTNKNLFYKIHPNNKKHDFEQRIECLKLLKQTGYQVGTGVMIGLPFQTFDNLADDLIFMRDFDIDMCGMGPYIEHKQTPLYKFKNKLYDLEKRFVLTLKMIAILRLLMPDINIAAATALQTADKAGREKALKIGANIIMPNITPGQYRDDYNLYENKPCTDENADDCKQCLEARIAISESTIGYGEWGDSLRFKNRKKFET